MKSIDKKTLVNAKRKAVNAWDKGTRYYDDKHKTYNPSSFAESVLQHVSDLVGYYGVEVFDSNSNHPKYSYINSGDTYALTLIYNHQTRKFIFCDIGTIIENEQAN